MKKRPVVIGISSVQQKGNFHNLDEALIMMDTAVKEAVEDTGNDLIKNYIDEIRIPKGFWKYRDPGKWIAKNNHFQKIPKTFVTKIGILQQSLINDACIQIEQGEIDASIILGGEARYKKLRSVIENKIFEETELIDNPDFYVKATEDLYGDEELHELGAMAVGYYGVIETALRNFDEESIHDHKRNIAKMYEKFSEVASKNKSAWLDKPYSAEEISTSSKKNKMISYPYNKLHCTSWNVNQSAALIICSEELANDLKIKEEKRVYPIASSENNHMIAIQQRPKLYESLGMKLAAKKIKEYEKELNIDLDAYDLYSCFPVAVKMFIKALKIKKDKPLSVTGSMPFAGGPLNSYVLHSSVEMIKKIRMGEVNFGLVTGVSGMMTKQSFCIWGNEYKKGFLHHDVTEKAALVEKPSKLSKETQGICTIIGYTFFEANDHKMKAILYLEDKNHDRKVLSSQDKHLIDLLESENCIGMTITFKGKKIIGW